MSERLFRVEGAVARFLDLRRKPTERCGADRPVDILEEVLQDIPNDNTVPVLDALFAGR